MCLSTAYYNSKDEENVAARYIAKVVVDGDAVVLTDVMGFETRIEGRLTFVDLTGGTVVIATGAA